MLTILWCCIEVRPLSRGIINSSWQKKAAIIKCISCNWWAKNWLLASTNYRFLRTFDAPLKAAFRAAFSFHLSCPFYLAASLPHHHQASPSPLLPECTEKLRAALLWCIADCLIRPRATVFHITIF